MADNNSDVFKMFAAEDGLDGDNYPMWLYMMQYVLAWDILVSLYASRNEAKIALLRKELESKIMNEKDDMDTFLAGFKDINEKLISVGEVISNNFLVQTVLDGLPDSY
ncbi:hypothetical protein L7F22_047755 [Adiantum nelumboides]|nr:hypothetical protein [Adiantum nelumboides]